MNINKKAILIFVIGLVAVATCFFLSSQSPIPNALPKETQRDLDDASDADLKMMGITREPPESFANQRNITSMYTHYKNDRKSKEYRLAWLGDKIYETVGYYETEFMPSGNTDVNNNTMAPLYSMTNLSNIDISEDKKIVEFEHFDLITMTYKLDKPNGEKLVEFFHSENGAKYYEFSAK